MSETVKVLVVEHNTAVAMMMTYLLSDAGFDVEPAVTGQKGMELATTRKYDAIVLDIDLADINGFTICRELKQRHISCLTPIILLSGNNLEERRAKAFECGAADFIEKPFHAFEFIQSVTSHIAETALA